MVANLGSLSMVPTPRQRTRAAMRFPSWVAAGQRQSKGGLEKLLVSLCVQLLDGLTNVLGTFSGTHEKRIVRFYNDETLNTHGHHELAWRNDHIPLRIEAKSVARSHVAVRVLGVQAVGY